PAAPAPQEAALFERPYPGWQSRRERNHHDERRRGSPWLLWLIGAIIVGGLICRALGLLGSVASTVIGAIAQNSPSLDKTPTRGEVSQDLGGATALQANIQVGTGAVQIKALTDNAALAVRGQYSGRGGVTVAPEYQLLGGKGILTLSQGSSGDEQSSLL